MKNLFQKSEIFDEFKIELSKYEISTNIINAKLTIYTVVCLFRTFMAEPQNQS